MTLSKLQSTILLLESKLDWHQTIPSQFARFGAPPGELATARKECPACGGHGTVNGRQGVERCVKCAGDGSYLVDAYTGFRSADDGPRATALTKHDRRRQADDELRRLTVQLEPPKSETTLLAETTPFVWERERDRHYRHGDYRALDIALEHLADRNPTAAHLVRWAYEYRVIKLGTAQPTVKAAAEMCVDVLNERMPDPVRVPAWLLPKHPAAHRVDKRKAAA